MMIRLLSSFSRQGRIKVKHSEAPEYIMLDHRVAGFL